MSANTSYTIKMLEARITLAKGGFNPGTGQAANTKIIRLGMDVEISKPGGKEKNKAKVRIYNLPLEDMETLTTLAFAPLKTDQNHIAVYAGDKQNGMTLAFSGDIVSAVPNFNAAPDPTFDCDCITGFVASLTPVPPLTAQGAQDVGNTLQSIAGQMGLTFVNRGVNVSLRNTCWVGGPMEQARQIADAARIALLVDDGEMIIAPPGMLREDVGASTPLWRGDTGMFGYPSFDSNGISVKGLYEPKCKLGGPIRIESVVPKASGLWQISSLSHKLQAGYPGATSWETGVKAIYPGQQNQKDGKS
ncbi:MAG: hypothetical protein EOM56_12190 [Deltaproteobacteria bacterium]|nr:hypothetical protein [Deltaproteobacteria bacterium]